MDFQAKLNSLPYDLTEHLAPKYCISIKVLVRPESSLGRIQDKKEKIDMTLASSFNTNPASLTDFLFAE